MNRVNLFVTSLYLTFAKHPIKIPVILHVSSLAKAPLEQHHSPTLSQLKSYYTFAVLSKALALKSVDFYQCQHKTSTFNLQTSNKLIDLPFPVLQVGAHYFAGFRGIVDVIERKYPHPSLFPTKNLTSLRGLINPNIRTNASNRRTLSIGLYSFLMHALTSCAISKPSFAERTQMKLSPNLTPELTDKNPIRRLNWYFAMRPGLAYDTVYPHLSDLLVNEFFRYIVDTRGSLTELGESLFPGRSRFSKRIEECDAFLEERNESAMVDVETAIKVARLYHDEGIIQCKEEDAVASLEGVEVDCKFTNVATYQCGGFPITVSTPTRDLTTRRPYYE